METKSLKERVEQRLAELNINAFEAARRGDLGRTFVNELLTGKKANVRGQNLERLAQALQTTPDWLLTGAKGPTRPETPEPNPAAVDPTQGSAGFLAQVRQMEADTTGRPLGGDLVGARDLPVFAAAMGGAGHLIVTFDPIDYVKRPAPLAHIRDGYAILVTGESMIPAFRPREMALVHPRLPPERETDVILYSTAPEGEAEATIKRLIGFNDREWTLEQYNPAREFKEFRQEWPVCHRVVGKYSAR